MESSNAIISDPTYESNIYVAQADALFRKEHIQDVSSYQINLALVKGKFDILIISH